MKLINLLKEAFIDAQGKLQDFKIPNEDKDNYIINVVNNSNSIKDFANYFSDSRTAYHRILKFIGDLLTDEWEERVANNHWGTNEQEEKEMWDKFINSHFTPRVAQQLYKLLSDLL